MVSAGRIHLKSHSSGFAGYSKLICHSSVIISILVTYFILFLKHPMTSKEAMPYLVLA